MERLSRHSLPIPKAVPAPLDSMRDASLAWLFQSLVSRLRGGTCFKACRRVGESIGV